MPSFPTVWNVEFHLTGFITVTLSSSVLTAIRSGLREKAGRNKEKLRRQVFESLQDLLKWKPPKITEIISSGILPAGGKLVLAGQEGVFKTMFSTYAAFCISRGLPLVGFKTIQTRVAMLQSELPKAMFQSRLVQFVNQHNPDFGSADIQFATALDIKLNKPTGIAQLVNAIKQLDIGLLILDPLYKVLSGNVSDWAEMQRLTDNLDYISRTYNCSIWLVHHKRKLQLIDGQIIDLGTDELIGSSILKDWADSILRLEHLPVQDELMLSFPKTRNARTILDPVRLKFDRQSLGFTWADTDIAAKDLKE